MEDRCEKTEKRIGYAMVFFFIVFLLIASKCSAQMKIYRDHHYIDKPEVISYFPEEGLRFEYKHENIFLNIFSDSINPMLYDTKVCAFYPKSIKNYKGNIVVGFKETTPRTFIVDMIDSTSMKDNNYVEYKGSDPVAIFCLTDRQYIYVYFEGIKQFVAPRNKESFFKDFYAKVFLKQ